jgi:predicted metal-dependent HD superfamily phosphohydrolase
MIKEVDLLSKVKKYCTGLLENAKCKNLPFHNIEHTLEVIANTKVILGKTTASKEEAETVLIAAWFHDVGFSELYNGHEEVSIKLANEFLNKEGYSSDEIKEVSKCIEATKMPQHPETELAKVLCDADLFHISTPNFFYRKQLLRKEWEKELSKYYTEIEWHQLNLEFLQNHMYQSDYGRATLAKGQKANIQKVKNLIRICKEK